MAVTSLRGEQGEQVRALWAGRLFPPNTEAPLRDTKGAAPPRDTPGGGGVVQSKSTEEKGATMALTQEIHNQVMAVRERVEQIVRDRLYDFDEPFSLDIEEAQVVADDIVHDLFDRGFINLEAVEADL